MTELLRTGQVARRIGCSPSTIRRAANRGLLKTTFLEGKCGPSGWPRRYFAPADVDAFIASPFHLDQRTKGTPGYLKRHAKRLEARKRALAAKVGQELVERWAERGWV